MKNYFVALILMVLLAACSETKKKEGIDFEKIKPSLNLTSDQTASFDKIVEKYEVERQEMVTEIRASGNMNKADFMKKIRTIFAKQGEEMKTVLSDEQYPTYASFVKKSLPGRINYSEKLIATLKEELQLDSAQNQMFDAINMAFEKAYIEAHDKYHGNNEAAKSYWNQFDEDRKNALKKVLSEEQYEQYQLLTKNETFRGEHGNGEEE